MTSTSACDRCAKTVKPDEDHIECMGILREKINLFWKCDECSKFMKYTRFRNTVSSLGNVISTVIGSQLTGLSELKTEMAKNNNQVAQLTHIVNAATPGTSARPNHDRPSKRRRGDTETPTKPTTGTRVIGTSDTLAVNAPSSLFWSFLVLSMALAIALGAAVEKPVKEVDTEKDLKTESSGKVHEKRGLYDFGYGSTPELQGGFKPSFGFDFSAPHQYEVKEDHHTIITKNIPVPYPVEVEKHVFVEKKVPVHIDRPVPYPVTVEKKVPYIVEKHIPFHVDRPVPYPVKVPYPVEVERKVPVYIEKKVHVDRPVPYPVHVEKKVPVYIEKKVPVYIEKKVPVPYEVKVPVVQKVEVSVPKPYPVHVPKPYPVYIEREVIKHVDRPVHVEVEKKVPVPVVQRVEVPQPYPVYIEKPVYAEKHDTHHSEGHQHLDHRNGDYIEQPIHVVEEHHQEETHHEESDQHEHEQHEHEQHEHEQHEHEQHEHEQHEQDHQEQNHQELNDYGHDQQAYAESTKKEVKSVKPAAKSSKSAEPKHQEQHHHIPTLLAKNEQ
ncbi:titin-like [Ochlerotatus camptorhynchus]|uniref:titin-like n=1 Tax=Ochlerotatus camptorhynchus TaxID=644619 RepID=UPI0031CE0AB1